LGQVSKADDRTKQEYPEAIGCGADGNAPRR
jgi:hypothetical protein